MKNRFTKLIIFITAICIITSLFASCSDSSKNDYESNYTPNDSDYVESKGDGFSGEASNGAVPSLNTEYERKIIKTANIRAETKEFDAAIAFIENLCTGVGGYIESSSISGNRYNSGRNERYANYTIRVPAENLDSFSSELGDTLNIISSSDNIQEVTGTYYDIKSRIEVLEMQKAALQELYDQYTDYGNINYLMELQDKLFDVIAEIEAYQTQIKLYDDKVAYSTVVLNISEVVDYTEIPEEKSYFTKLGESFLDGFELFVDILSGLSMAAAFLLPVLLPIAVILTVALVLVKKKRKSIAPTSTDEKEENK